MDSIVLAVTQEDVGARLDAFVSRSAPELSRSAVQRLCEESLVRVDGVPASKKHRMQSGEQVEVSLPPPKPLALTPQAIPLDIVYEDGDLLVVNKPKGMVVHPAPGNEDGTLVNALLHHCGPSLAGIGGVARPGIVHRIDKDTSGLLVVAKTEAAHQSLSEQIGSHTVTRRYHAVVYGSVKAEEGRVDAPIGRHPVDRKRMCVTAERAREAATRYTVQERLRGFTWLELALETGRTHQIRVHMAYIGHPVAGDPVYGPKKVITSLGGQCLHARTLGFDHPRTGAYMEFDSDPPAVFVKFLQKHREANFLP